MPPRVTKRLSEVTGKHLALGLRVLLLGLDALKQRIWGCSREDGGMTDLCWGGGVAPQACGLPGRGRRCPGPPRCATTKGRVCHGQQRILGLLSGVESERGGACAAGKRLGQVPEGGKRETGRERTRWKARRLERRTMGLEGVNNALEILCSQTPFQRRDGSLLPLTPTGDCGPVRWQDATNTFSAGTFSPPPWAPRPSTSN